LRTEGVYETKKDTARGGLPHQTVSAHPSSPDFSASLPCSTPSNFDKQFLHHPVDPSLLLVVLPLSRSKKEKKSGVFPLVVRGTDKISRFPRNQDGGVEEVAPPPRRSPLSSITRKSSGRVSSVHRSLRVCRCRASLPNLVRGKERGAFLDR